MVILCEWAMLFPLIGCILKWGGIRPISGKSIGQSHSVTMFALLWTALMIPSTPIYLRACLSTCLSAFLLSYPAPYLPTLPNCLRTCLSTYLTIYLHTHLQTYRHISLHTHLNTYLSTYLLAYINTLILVSFPSCFFFSPLFLHALPLLLIIVLLFLPRSSHSFTSLFFVLFLSHTSPVLVLY